MAGMFDDLIPDQAAPAAQGAVPQPVAAAPAGGGLFDDLIPQASAGQPAPLTIQGSPQSAGDALDMVEGTGTAAYNTGAPEGGATYGDRVRNLGGAVAAGLDSAAGAVPFTDRLAALAAAGTGIGGKFGDYSGNLAQLRGEEGATMDAHPTAALVGSLAGGAMLPAGVVGDVAKGASLGAKAVKGMVAGGLIGGAQGASQSNDLTDAKQTGLDAGIGAVGGGIIGGALPFAGSGYGAVQRMLTRDAVGAVPGVNNAARDVMLSAIAKDGPEAVQRNAALYGDPAMLFDYGPGLRGIAEGLATKDGAAAATVGDALGSRQAATNARVRQGLVDNFGPAQDPSAVAQSIADTQQAATTPLFARAYAAGQPYTPELANLVQRPAVASAIQDAATSAANSGQPLGSITLDAAGNPVSSDAALQAFNAGTRPAVTGALADALGSNPALGPLATTDALTAQRSAAADPLYRAYRSMSVPMTDELASVLNRPSVAAALPAAERKAADQGRSIYVRGPAPTPRGSSDIPDPFADLGQPYTVEPTQGSPSVQTGAPPRPTGPAPVSLTTFLQRAGGVRDPGGDLRSMGLDRFPGLVSDRGVPLDRAREMAAEAGYLGGDTAHAVANTTPNDLLGALGSHPTYSAGDADAVAQRQAYDAYQASRGTATSHDYAMEAVRSHLLDNGVPANSIDPTTLDTAARFVDHLGMNPGDAWESAVMSPPFPGDTPMQAPGAPATPPRQITPEGLDFIKRALGDKIDAAQTAGSRDDARIYTGLKNDLLMAIDNHPDPTLAGAYRAARQAYAGPSREIDALDAGRAALADTVTPERVARDFAALQTDGERQRFRDGLFSAMRDKLGKASDTANFVNQVAGNQALRDKFATVAHSPEALERFNATMDRARQRFTEATQPTPAALHGALDTLDTRAAKGEPGMVAARDALAAHMAQNPDFARARGIQQDYAGLQDAIGYGRQSLAAGGDPVWPSAFQQRLAGMSPAGAAATRVGQRAVLEEAVGVKPNDQLAIKGLLQTGNTPGYTAPDVTPGNPDLSGWNAQKLATAFGEAPVGRMQELLNANDAFNSTFNAVANNSRTARRQEMVKALQDAEWKPRDLMREGHGDDTLLGLGRSVLAKGVNAVGHAVQNAPSTVARDADLARLGTLTGSERAAALRSLLDRLPAYTGREDAVAAQQRQALITAALLAGGGSQAIVGRPSISPAVLAQALRGQAAGAQR